MTLWLHHFLPLEVGGTLAAIAGGFAVWSLTDRSSAAIYAATIAESIAFYAIAGSRELRTQWSVSPHATRRLLKVAGRCTRNLALDFGPAEIIDTLIVRPLAMFLFERATGNLLLGILLGKLATDVSFYFIAIPSFELRRRIFDGGTVKGNTPPLLQTPRLVMDTASMTRSFSAFTDAFADSTIHYATKCNPDPAVVRHLHSLGSQFEIASAAELDILTAAGVDPAAVLFSNPVKRNSDIRLTFAQGVWRFAVDSLLEVDKVARNAPGSAVLVRMAAPPSLHSEIPSEGKFGIGESATTDLVRYAVKSGLRPYGLAFHVGSQMLDVNAWTPAISSAGRVMRSLADEAIVLDALDIGGGFPAAYDGVDVPSIYEYADIIQHALKEQLPYSVSILIEPGRALVAEAGTMIARVIGVAERNGSQWVHLDVGAFNGMMEALESDNSLLFPVSDSRNSTVKMKCNLTGPSCDSQDTILFDTRLSADLELDDLVYIHCAGAYTTSYASNFNGFDIPDVVDGTDALHPQAYADIVDIRDLRPGFSDQTAV